MIFLWYYVAQTTLWMVLVKVCQRSPLRLFPLTESLRLHTVVPGFTIERATSEFVTYIMSCHDAVKR